MFLRGSDIPVGTLSFLESREGGRRCWLTWSSGSTLWELRAPMRALTRAPPNVKSTLKPPPLFCFPGKTGQPHDLGTVRCRGWLHYKSFHQRNAHLCLSFQKSFFCVCRCLACTYVSVPYEALVLAEAGRGRLDPQGLKLWKAVSGHVGAGN